MTDVSKIAINTDSAANDLLLDQPLNRLIAEVERNTVFLEHTERIMANAGIRHQFVRHGGVGLRTNYSSGEHLSGNPDLPATAGKKKFSPDDPTRTGATAPNFTRKEYFFELDGTIIADQYLGKDDVMVSQYNMSDALVRKLAFVHALEPDLRILFTMIEAATTAAVTDIHPGGVQVTQTSGGADWAGIQTAFPLSSTGSTRLINQLQNAREKYAENHVTQAYAQSGLNVALSPYLINVLNFDEKQWHRDYNTNSNYPGRVIGQVAGFNVIEASVMQNGIPNRSSMDFETTAANAKYQKIYNDSAEDGNIAAVMWAGDKPVSEISNRDLELEIEWISDVDSWFYKAAQRTGYGVLEVERMGVLKVTA